MIRCFIQNFVGNIEGAFPEANRASYALKVRSQQQFQKLLTMSALLDGTPLSIVEHPTLNSTRCVVSCRDVISFPESELLEELIDQGVKEVRRITRRAGTERENTPAIIPSCLSIWILVSSDAAPGLITRVQCSCWAFGHKNPTCGKCSEEHPIAEDRTCNNETFCTQCNSNIKPQLPPIP